MTMKAIKKGGRFLPIKIRIDQEYKVIYFSAGFCREYSFSDKTIKFVRLGYDTETNKIGIEFCKDNDNSGGLYKFSIYGGCTSTSYSCHMQALLTDFKLNISDIAGSYFENAIEGPVNIPQFCKNGFLLNVYKRVKV